MKVLKFYPTDLPVRNKKERVKVLDVLLKTKDKKYVHCEVNTSFDEATRVRNLCFFNSYYSEKVKRGKKYDTRSEFVHLDFNFIRKAKGNPKKVYQILNTETTKPYVKNYKIITINLATIKKECYHKNIQGEKENIHLVMLSANEKELMELSKQDELVKEFDEKMFVLNSDNTFTRTISEERDQELLMNARIEIAEEKAAKKRNIEIAKRMLQKTDDISYISEMTDLPKGKIRKLQKKLKIN